MFTILFNNDAKLNEHPRRYCVAIGELDDHYLVLLKHAEGVGTTVHAVPKADYRKETDEELIKRVVPKKRVREDDGSDLI